MPFELDTKALRYFVAVATRRSYTRAAAALRITQPAVTRQVQAIEREFGLRLFRREGQFLALTESGEALLEEARDILGRIDAAGCLLKDAALQPGGRISIGAPAALGELLLPPIMANFRHRHPKVMLYVTIAYSGELAEMVVQGRVDFAVLFGNPLGPELELQHLFDVDLGVIGSPRLASDPLAGLTSISLAEAARLPLVFPSGNQGLRRLLDREMRQAGVHPNVVAEADATGITRELVKTGLGCMIMNLEAVRREVDEGELRYVPLAPALRIPLSLATRRGKSASLASRMLRKAIVEAAGPAWQARTRPV